MLNRISVFSKKDKNFLNAYCVVARKSIYCMALFFMGQLKSGEGVDVLCNTFQKILADISDSTTKWLCFAYCAHKKVSSIILFRRNRLRILVLDFIKSEFK